MILSASRRTDIPAFFGEWLLNRMRAGEVCVRNPMNHSQVSRIPLDPRKVECVVFWTKDPRNFIRYLREIDALGYKYYFLFTINAYDRTIERGLRDKGEIIDTFVELADTIGAEKVVWRYDPIAISPVYAPEYHVKWFERAASRLRGHTERCVISFVDRYGAVKKSMDERGLREPSVEEMEFVAEKFAEICAACGIEARSCCEKIDLEKYGIKRNKCVDDQLIARITGKKISGAKDRSQRTLCGCVKSRDIGAYDTCGHGCAYCYANASDAEVRANRSNYDPDSSLLCDRELDLFCQGGGHDEPLRNGDP